VALNRIEDDEPHIVALVLDAFDRVSE